MAGGRRLIRRRRGKDKGKEEEGESSTSRRQGDPAEAENPTNEPETQEANDVPANDEAAGEPIAAPEEEPYVKSQELGAAAKEEPEGREPIAAPKEEPEGGELSAAPEEKPDEPRERLVLGEANRELRTYLRTRLINCLRINRRSDPRYAGQLEEIARDLDIYLSHPSGRDALFRPRNPKPKEDDKKGKAKVVGKGTGAKARARALEAKAKAKAAEDDVYQTALEDTKSNIKELSGAKILSNHFAVHFSKNHESDQEFQFYGVHINRRLTAKERVDFLYDLPSPGTVPHPSKVHRSECIFMFHGADLLSYGNLYKDASQRAQTYQTRVAGVTLTISYKETVDKESHIRYMMANQGDVAEFPQRTIQALNMIVKEIYRTRDYLESKDMAFDEKKKPVDRLLEARQGYFQSVRVLEGGLTVNVDTMEKVFYKENKNLEELLNDMLESKYFSENHELFPNKQLSVPPERRQLDFVNKYWKGLQIQSSHMTKLRRTDNWKPEYSICEVASEMARRKTVLVPCRRYDNSSAVQENLLAFMTRRYNYNDQRSLKGHLPAIKVSAEGRYLPWGCCKTTKMSRFTGKPIIPPVDVAIRYKLIHDWMEKRKEKRAEVWAEDMFNVDVSTDMIEVQNSLTIDKPQIVAGADDASDGSDSSKDSTPRSKGKSTSNVVRERDISGKKYWLPAKVLQWGVLSFMSKDADVGQMTLVEDVRQAARNRGMTWTEKESVFKRIEVKGTYEGRRKAVEDALSETFNDQQLDLIVCFMATKLTPEYPAVKVGCDRTLGVASQVIIFDSNAKKRNKVHMRNLALKINVKCGGVNFKLRWPLQDLGSRRAGPIILLGADVTHPGSGDNNTRSIAAVVATTSSEAVNYTCRVTILPARQEIISNLKGLVLELLDNYVKTEKQHPQTIYYFRDGISEMDLISALRYEGHAIMEAAQELANARDPGGRQPDLVIVLAIKRHHTRFFLFKDGDNDIKKGLAQNLEPGTVIHQTVTHPIEFDFFLCSHKALRGTSRPVRYHVLLDQVDLDHHKLYEMVYSLCYTFQRSYTSVSLVTPVLYAHLLAARARLYLDYLPPPNPGLPRPIPDLQPHENLRDRLWFL